MSHLYLKRWRQSQAAAVSLAMLSSESSSDECLPHKQLTRLTSGTEGLSNCESELSVAFEVPDYIESSESELEDSE